MLDVHPAHHAATTWRDFFIHIATIVLGLLIAVGLEQTVEYVHHRHQIAETRGALRIEREQNRRRYALVYQEFRRQKGALEANLTALLYLQQHPGASADQMPNPIVWHIFTQRFNDSAWQTAQRSGTAALMPSEEISRDAGVYRFQDRITDNIGSLAQAFAAARRYTFQDSNPSHLGPVQIAEEIDLTKTVMLNLYNLGTNLRNMSLEYKEFGPGPNTQELLGMMHDDGIQETMQLLERNVQQQHDADELKDPIAPPSD